MELIKIKPEHFINSEGYISNEKCPFALALNDHFGRNDCWCYFTLANVGGTRYEADPNWNVRTSLFKGTLFEGMDVHQAINFAQSNPTHPDLPTIEVWVKR